MMTWRQFGQQWGQVAKVAKQELSTVPFSVNDIALLYNFAAKPDNFFFNSRIEAMYKPDQLIIISKPTPVARHGFRQNCKTTKTSR